MNLRDKIVGFIKEYNQYNSRMRCAPAIDIQIDYEIIYPEPTNSIPDLRNIPREFDWSTKERSDLTNRKPLVEWS